MKRKYWKPVLQALALKGYHPDYDQVIMVCINPQPEILQECGDVLQEYSLRIAELQKQKPGACPDQKLTELTSWLEKQVEPKINQWFARLWSYGSETFTADDLAGIHHVDPHLLNWLKRRTLEMINSQRKALEREQHFRRTHRKNTRLH